MGRCNNQKTQAQAEANKFSSARSRFSKGPPKKTGRGGGRGRGGRGGRGDATVDTAGRGGGRGGGGRGGGGRGGGRGEAADKTKSNVVNKITKRAAEKKVGGNTSSGGVKTNKHPLDGVDVSKLDEVTLSDESIQLVTKLLQDLNVMESDGRPRLDEDDNEIPDNGLSGYTEHEDDTEVFDEDYEDEDEPPQDSTAADEALRNSPLFQHLSVKLSFSEEHATRACRGIENWNLATDSEEESSFNSETLAHAMDWLCLHLTDAELKEGFKVNPKSLAKRSSTGILLVGSGKTRAVPHASISLAKPLTSDSEWRETGRREARKVGFVRLGFSSLECETACDKAPDLPVKSAVEDETAMRIMLALLEREALNGVASPSAENAPSADLKFAKEEQEQEVHALEAIFDNCFQRKESRNGLDRFVIKIALVENLRSPGNSDACRLHIFARAGYPILTAPLLLFTNPTLPPSLLRRINSCLAQQASHLIGEPAIFSLVDFLSTSLLAFQMDFMKEQRARELEAGQLRMRRAAGHNVESVIERPGQLQAKEEERRRGQDERVVKVQSEDKRIRVTRAEREIEERNRERYKDEAEKAARSAMNKAFNEGKSTEEARYVANEARKESLRHNGIEVPADKATNTPKAVVGSAKEKAAPPAVNARKEKNKEQEVAIDKGTTTAATSTQKKATSATTTAFMEKLRDHYNKAELSSKNAKESSSDMQITLSEPKSRPSNARSDSGEVLHIPAPIPIPTGDLGKVMNDVIKVQLEQPWLVSAEARVPNSRTGGSDLTSDQLRQRNETSKRLLTELERKYKAAEQAGERKPKGAKIGKGGSPPEIFYRMLCQRRNLPAYKMKDEIIQKLESSQILVVSGDTGCGKTTQVPQLILDDLIWKGRGAEANMIVTQPRRISAIGVSERVAAERCEKVGETSGYSIRLENKRSNKTRILLCTTGILLRRLQCDPDLASVSHIFVDEVHERDLNTDFLLIILKDLLARRKSLKLVLMSATLNADAFSSYFGGCPVVSIPGRAHPVTEHRLEDILKLTGYEVPPRSDYVLKTSPNKPPRYTKAKLQQMYHPKYPTSVISSLAIVDETVINYELLAKLLEHIALSNDEGAILVFMPGMAEITKAVEELYKKEFFKSSKVEVYPLHSSLSTAEQISVFEVPAEGVRKIVISTNIAETSITIEDVVFVVDCGRVKENRKDELNEMPTLVETWVSRASAKQRRGRAGRVRPGVAYHMYSSHTFQYDMQEYQLPEMLRVGLEDLVLQILLLDLGEPSSFLGKAVNPPSALALKNSLKLLESLGAVEVQWNKNDITQMKKEDSENSCATIAVDSGLTALGFHLATLPVDPRVGKMMIYGALFGCTDPALTIAASMSARSPFMSPFDKREQADEARQAFATEGSDPLTTLTAFSQWKEMRRTNGERATKDFMRDSFLSRLTLFQMEDLRKQFAKNLVDIGFLPKGFRLPDNRNQGIGNKMSISANANSENVALIKTILCAGLYPNIIVAPRDLVAGRPSAKAAGEVAFRGLKGDVYLHPCTISHKSKRLDSRYCCYHDIVKTSKIYVRDCTTVSPIALLLFGGSLQVYHSKHIVTVDQWLQFKIGAKPATLVKHLRAQMESLLLKKIISPQEDVTGSKEGQALIQAVSTLLANEKPAALPGGIGAEFGRPLNGNNDNREMPRGGRGRGQSGEMVRPWVGNNDNRETPRGGRGRGQSGNNDNRDTPRGGRGRGQNGNSDNRETPGGGRGRGQSGGGRGRGRSNNR